MNVAKTILRQLGGNRFAVMTGAKNLCDHGDGLSMRLPGNGFCRDGINYLKITLTPADTYSLEFGRIWGTKYTVVNTVDEVYCDGLRDVFTRVTGLETSLGTLGR